MAANMKAKSELMIELHDFVVKQGLTQAQSSKKLNITEPRLDDLLKGRINCFSLNDLLELASRAGLELDL